MNRQIPRWMWTVSVLVALMAWKTIENGQAALQAETPSPVAKASARADGQPAVASAAQDQKPGPATPVPQSQPASSQEAGPAKARVARPTTSIPTDACVTGDCHPNIKAAPVKHGPVAADACDACHEELDASKHTFELTETGGALCEICHELDLEEEHVHQPVADGQCGECHDPHGGRDEALLRRDSLKETCAECHDDVTEDLPVVHGPVAAGECTACHQPHASDHAKLLTNSGRALCFDCHTTIEERMDSARNVHAPASEDCATCHLPHAADEPKLLTEKLTELCLDCHSDVADAIDEATVKHDAVTKSPACANCHDPHGSNTSPLLLQDMVDLCLSCHDREIEMPDGTRLMSVKAMSAPGVHLHGPIAQRDCTPCHEVHGGTRFRLLAEEYPPTFYAPFREESYALCFSCHEDAPFQDPRTEDLTDFRDGSRNLHYLHVNKPKKGRTCRACHEPHASQHPKQIRDTVPFDSSTWMMPIGFEKTETGGRCSPGCHRPVSYDRGQSGSDGHAAKVGGGTGGR